MRPHLTPETRTDVAYGLANCQSVKKPIDVVLIVPSRQFLKALILVQYMKNYEYDALMTVPTVNDTRSQKK